VIAWREMHVKETNGGIYGTRLLAEITIALLTCNRAVRSGAEELRALVVLAYFSRLPRAGIRTRLHHYSFDVGDDSALKYRDA